MPTGDRPVFPDTGLISHDLPSGDGSRAGRPKRRTFSAAYELRMAEEYDAAEHGEKGSLLRREGLYEPSIQFVAATA